MVVNEERERVETNSFSMPFKVPLCALFLNNFDRVAVRTVVNANVTVAVVAVLANLYIVVRAVADNVNA